MAQNKGRIVLALQAYELGQFTSLQAAAHLYGVSHMTLARQYKGIPSRADFISPHLKLTQMEKATLVQ
jgi:hypothetical protein